MMDKWTKKFLVISLMVVIVILFYGFVLGILKEIFDLTKLDMIKTILVSILTILLFNTYWNVI